MVNVPLGSFAWTTNAPPTVSPTAKAKSVGLTDAADNVVSAESVKFATITGNAFHHASPFATERVVDLMAVVANVANALLASPALVQTASENVYPIATASPAETMGVEEAAANALQNKAVRTGNVQVAVFLIV